MSGAGFVCMLLVLGFLLQQGILLLNNPSHRQYPVRGVDVSAWQGDIDWQALSGQGIQFAYIKATEGSTWKDERFLENWLDAGSTTLAVGAYHFLSFESDGEAQAQNFIDAVPNQPDSLPCAVDVELYGKYMNAPPSKEQVDDLLKPLLARLESHYGRKPILYCTQQAYRLYIRDGYSDYPLWIRNVFTAPSLGEGQRWTFWQYADRGRLRGYKGRERFIDMNVFRGSVDDFAAILQR